MTEEKLASPCVVCGPSGVGKGTLLDKVKDALPNTFGVAVSHTTRKPRPGEIDGEHYNFTTKEEFQKGIKNGDFVEYADVNGNYYGTSIKSIQDVQEKKLICILEIDVQGAKIIKDAKKIDAHYLFVTCNGGIDTLKKRLTGRNTESDQQIKKRLNTAEKELTFLNQNHKFFQCVISNDDLQESTQTLINQFKSWYCWINESTEEVKEEKKAENADKSNIESCPTVVCGPSGVGKGTLLDRVKELLPNTFGVAVSHTTRKPRQGEIDGQHYNFSTKEEFEKGIKNGDFVEYADVNGNYYGTSIEGINNVSTQNLICILEIDVQGAKIIKDAGKLNAKYLFITTEGGLDTLKKRLTGRNTETEQQIKRRLNTAEKEFTFLNENEDFFDRVISNDDLEESAQRLAQQFKTWYPWIISDNLEPIDPANDDEKKTTSSYLLYERQALDGLFNALQFEVSIYDLRSKDEYNKLHVMDAINIPNLSSLDKITKLQNVRIFIYGNGKQSDEYKEKCNKLYEIAKKLNAVQFCVINNGFEEFEKLYSFLCINDNNKMDKDRTRYPNSVGNIDNRLYVGGEAHAFDVNVIKNLGITHIVNTKGTPTKLDEEVAKTIKYFNVKVEDTADQSVAKFFDKTSEFVENALKENDKNRILIHCGGGKSRSTTFTMAYLMKYRKQTLAFAYGTVSISRPKAFPNDGFLKDLANYELNIYAKSTKQFIEKSKLRNKARWKKVCSSWKIQ